MKMTRKQLFSLQRRLKQIRRYIDLLCGDMMGGEPAPLMPDAQQVAVYHQLIEAGHRIDCAIAKTSQRSIMDHSRIFE